MKNLGKTYCRLLLLPICPDMFVCSLLFCVLILHSIEYLFLGINTLSGNSFSGTVSNTLTGTIPSEIGLLSYLSESCCHLLLLPIYLSRHVRVLMLVLQFDSQFHSIFRSLVQYLDGYNS